MDGILIVNKPKQYTSHDIVAIVKKMCNEKVGHTGTLDPMATGVLPLLLGKGTKLSKYLVEHDKIYIATIKLGKRTNTLDSEGDIIEEKNVDVSILNEEKIKNILEKQKGKQIQIPPVYSAIKVNGKKLYEYARKGIQVEAPKREIEIYDIKLLNIDKTDKTIKFRVHCSKGTYIRTLCEKIAQNLNTIGYMKELQRIKVGQFDIEQSITIEQLEKNKELLYKNIITIQEFFKNYPIINLEKNKEKLFINGVQLTYNNLDGLYQIKVNSNIIGIRSN